MLVPHDYGKKIPITKRDIVEIYNQTKIGSKIRFRPVKLIPDHEYKERPGSAWRKGKVVHKTKRFAVVELKHGVTECVHWSDIITVRRKRDEKNN